MPSIGPVELVIVLIIALIVLGPKRLPSAARSVGTGLREFKDSLSRATPTAKELDVRPAAAADEQPGAVS